MKLGDILLTASSNLLRSKLRTSLTVVAIFIGALTLTLTAGIGSGVSQYIDRQLGNLGAEDILLIQPAQNFSLPGMSSEPKKYDPAKQSATTAGGGSYGQSVLKDSDITKIKAYAGIKEVIPVRMPSPDYIQGRGDSKYMVVASQDTEGVKYDLAAGRAVNLRGSQHEIMLPSGYVKALGYHSPQEAIGQTITLAVTNSVGGRQLFPGTVVGVLNKGIIDSSGATLNLSYNQALYDFQTRGLPEAYQHQYPMVQARFDSTLDEAGVTKLKEKLAKGGYSAQTVQDAIGVFKQVIAGIIAVLTFFAAIALFAASFGIINTLLMAVQERTKEIGLMKAMGMGSGRVFLLFSAEAVMLGFWGSLLGILAAIGIGRVANHFASTMILKDLPGFQLLVFPWEGLLQTMLLIMGIAFVAGTLPARRAAKQNPIDALRYE